MCANPTLLVGVSSLAFAFPFAPAAVPTVLLFGGIVVFGVGIGVAFNHVEGVFEFAREVAEFAGEVQVEKLCKILGESETDELAG